jgi:4-amino-4-deoxychorismate lyase
VQSVIHPSDRSFNYGDGIFTTVQVRQGKLLLWPLHLQRLQRASAQLGFGAIDWQQLQLQAASAVSRQEQVVKILISRGEGGRGYAYTDVTVPKIYISTSVLGDYRPAQQQGITLGMATLRLAVQPLLAGLKHNNRLEQVLLKQELANSGFDELLVLDQLGFITEASAANVLFYRAGQWYTPELMRAGVAGVMRQNIMQQQHINQVNWTTDELHSVEAMCICNALMGIVPVRSFDNNALSIQPVQQLIQQVVC